jgi:hypothetical protein
MADPLSSNTQEQMQALCRKISVAHDLDPEIQKELYGHMEDKLLAYLSGAEQVTEEDAFILVREHFGDPAVLKGLLQDVHAREVHVSLARRLAAAAVATMGIFVAANVLRSITALFLFRCVQIVESLDFISSLSSGFIGGASAILLWFVLGRWQRQIDANERPWFLRWRPGWIAVLILLLLVFSKLVPVVLPAPGEWDEHVAQWPMRFQGAYLCLFLLFRLLPLVLKPLAWLWWCDRPPRKPLALMYGFLGWLVFNPFWVSLSRSSPRITVYVTRSLSWHASFAVQASKPLEAGIPTHFYYLYYLTEHAVQMVLLGIIVFLLYALIQYVRCANAALQSLSPNPEFSTRAQGGPTGASG